MWAATNLSRVFKGIDFRAEASFLVSSQLVHSEWKNFFFLQQFSVHGRFYALVVTGLFLNSLTNFLSSEVDSLDFL